MINDSIERPPAEIVEGFRNLLRHDSITCAISDCMGRFNAMISDMRPLFEGIRLVGTAVTVKTLASDLAAAFKAIDVCQPGDVVVIDSHGSINTAFWGENMTMSALNRGVIGAVIDGACRDVEEIRRIGFPVICKGVVPNVGAIAGYGDVNVPIQCAGVAVSPGDVVVVDGRCLSRRPLPFWKRRGGFWRRSISFRRRSRLARPSVSWSTSMKCLGLHSLIRTRHWDTTDTSVDW